METNYKYVYRMGCSHLQISHYYYRLPWKFNSSIEDDKIRYDAIKVDFKNFNITSVRWAFHNDVKYNPKLSITVPMIMDRLAQDCYI